MTSGSVARDVGGATVKLARWGGGLLRGHMIDVVGGPARARVILLLACVLALSSAQTSTVSSLAPQLQHAFHIGNTRLGLLSSLSLLVGAVFVIPFGMLVDRIKRVQILAASIVLWSVATLAGAFAGSYSTLLLTRVALGAVTATAGPAIASLTGDYFPSRERGRIYAYILGGELAGTGIGFTVCSLAGSVISWRAGFVLVALPGFFLARALWQTLPEPRRGGQSRLARGVIDLSAAVAARPSQRAPGDTQEAEADEEIAYETVRNRGITPDPRIVLRVDPRTMRIGDAVRYVLSIPTNMLLIISSALGYFFYSGLLAFLVVFVRGHYQVSQATSTLVILLLLIAAVIGTLVSGRLTDLIVRRGFLEARVWVPAICYVAATLLFIPGIIGSHLTPALWFDVAGAALLSAANPPLDAARLDIVPSGLWGRAESTRTVVRSLAQAVAPIMFGLIADAIAGFTPKQVPIGAHAGGVSASTGSSLEYTFLIMLVALGGAGWFMIRARFTYIRDVAAAAAAHVGPDLAADPGSNAAPASGLE